MYIVIYIYRYGCRLTVVLYCIVLCCTGLDCDVKFGHIGSDAGGRSVSHGHRPSGGGFQSMVPWLFSPGCRELALKRCGVSVVTTSSYRHETNSILKLICFRNCLFLLLISKLLNFLSVGLLSLSL